MEPFTAFFKDENDFLYRKGFAKAEAKYTLTVTKNLILKLGFKDEQIAECVEVDID